MEVLISGRNFEITQGVRNSIEGAVQSAMHNKTLTFTSARVVVELIKHSFCVSMDLIAKDHEFTTKVEDIDFEVAVDKAASKVEAQMAKVMDKLHHKRFSGETLADVIDE